MNDLVSPEEIATNELSNADCLQLVSHSSLTQVFSQLSLWEKECQIDSHTSSSKFKAAALWHDLRQLLATKPRLSWARRAKIFSKLLPFHKGNHCFSEKIFGKSSPDSRKTFYPCPAWTMARWLSGLTVRVIVSLKHGAISELHPLTCVGALAEEVAAKPKCTA